MERGQGAKSGLAVVACGGGGMRASGGRGGERLRRNETDNLDPSTPHATAFKC